ncbi:MAG: monooxygenase, partial [Acidobacteria bacterium]
DAETFARNGFGEMSEEEARHVCERVFEEDLAGEKLVSNRSIWRRFPNVRNRHWSHDRYVLVGDALRTAHFSIGSGTRLAIEDAIALERALYDTGYNIPAALEGYEVARRPIVEKLLEAADSSARWYESFPQHMRLQTMEFAMSYIQRSGRVDFGKLRLLSPKFVAAYEEQGLSEGYFLQ